MRLLKTLLRDYKSCIVRFNNNCADAWETRDWLGFLKNFSFMTLMLAIPVCAMIAMILLVYRWWKLLLALATPPLMLAVLVASYFENHKADQPPPPPPPLPSIDTIQANARRTYRSMSQTAFLLLTDLCRYLPGLVQPFSLASVEAPVHFDITASMVTLYHFVIGKGENDLPVSAMAEILGNIISQHLQAQDLPVSVPAVYTSMDGSTWPGMVVDGVYDLGQTYRIDLIITNEAVVSRLKARTVSGLDGYDLGSQTVHDPDFD